MKCGFGWTVRFYFSFINFFFLAVVVYHTGQSSTYTMKLAELSSELFVAQRGGENPNLAKSVPVSIIYLFDFLDGVLHTLREGEKRRTGWNEGGARLCQHLHRKEEDCNLSVKK